MTSSDSILTEITGQVGNKQNINKKNTDSVEELVCIVCPRGCRLNVRTTADGLAVSGNFCPRGETYAVQELTNPTRVLTALMRPQGSDRPISVKTDRPVPKDLLFACAAEIYRTHPALPVHRGDILIRDLCGTEACVLATRDMSAT